MSFFLPTTLESQNHRPPLLLAWEWHPRKNGSALFGSTTFWMDAMGPHQRMAWYLKSRFFGLRGSLYLGSLLPWILGLPPHRGVVDVRFIRHLSSLGLFQMTGKNMPVQVVGHASSTWRPLLLVVIPVKHGGGGGWESPGLHLVGTSIILGLGGFLGEGDRWTAAFNI